MNLYSASVLAYMFEGFGIESVDAKKSSRNQRKPTQVVEIGYIQQSLVKHFEDIKDPRVERTKKHLLTDILVIAILAIIAGAAVFPSLPAD